MGAPSPPRRKLIFAAPSLYIAPEAVQDREGLPCARYGTAAPPLRVPTRVPCRAGGEPAEWWQAKGVEENCVASREEDLKEGEEKECELLHFAACKREGVINRDKQGHVITLANSL